MKNDVIDTFVGEYEFLSNFYPSPIIMDDGIAYPTVEHAFQAYKTENLDLRIQMANVPTPGRAKRAGRQINLRDDWGQIRLSVMAIAIRKKFELPELRYKLLATGDSKLIEGTTWHDNYWGNCTCDKCKDIIGENQLGEILMAERARIRAMNEGA